MKTVPKTAAPIVYPLITALHLADARLCVACDMIHDQASCPSCTSTSSLSMRDLLSRRHQRMGNLVEVDLKVGEPPVRLVVDEPAA